MSGHVMATSSPALSWSRRRLLTLATGAAGGAALTALSHPTGAATVFAQPQPEEAAPEGAIIRTIPFEFAVRQGPSAGLSAVGLLLLMLDSDGQILRGRFVSQQGQDLAAVTGQVLGSAVNLAFVLPDGAVIYGTGTSRTKLLTSEGGMDLGGPLVGPQPGDSGDWLGQGDQLVTLDANNTIITSSPLEHVVYATTNANMTPTVYAGRLNTPGNADGNRLSVARFNNPIGLGAQYQGTPAVVLYIADALNQAVRRLGLPNAGLRGGIAPDMVDTIVSADVAKASGISEFRPYDCLYVTIDGTPYVLITDNLNHVIWRAQPAVNQRLTLFAGTVGRPGYTNGDPGAGTFRNPTYLGLIQQGTAVIVADANSANRRVDLRSGRITQ